MEVSLAVLADYVVVSHDQKLSILGIFNNINGVHGDEGHLRFFSPREPAQHVTSGNVPAHSCLTLRPNPFSS